MATIANGWHYVLRAAPGGRDLWHYFQGGLCLCSSVDLQSERIQESFDPMVPGGENCAKCVFQLTGHHFRKNNP